MLVYPFIGVKNYVSASWIKKKVVKSQCFLGAKLLKTCPGSKK